MLSNNTFEFTDDDILKTFDIYHNKKEKVNTLKLNYIQNGFLVKERSSKQVHNMKRNLELHKAISEGLISVVKAVVIDDGSLVNTYDEEGI